MMRVIFGLAFVCLLPGSILASAQSVVHLCVANTQLAGAPAANGDSRDQLIKFLQKEKPDKNVKIEDVPLDASVPDQVLASAKENKCDYVVMTNQVESHSANTFLAPSGTMGTTSTPTFYVTTAYTLKKVSDGVELASGSFKASDNGSERNAVGFTMHKIASKVTDAIKKAGGSAK